MKRIIFLLAAGFCSLAAAQTNVPLSLSVAAPAAKAKPHAPTITMIDSDMADFDMNLHQAIYRGHVLVVDPQVRLTCEWLLVDLPAGGEHLNHVLATTNVVVDFTNEKGEKYHVTAAKAVYDYKVVEAVTNETVTFTGKPVVETATSIIYSEPMVWDRARNHFIFTEPQMISKDNGGTNSSPMNFLK
jgi:lipopolysaccharide export system protein LptA